MDDDRNAESRRGEVFRATEAAVSEQAQLMDQRGTAWNAVKHGNLEAITNIFPSRGNVYAKGPVGNNVLHLAVLLNTPSTLAIARYLVRQYGKTLVNTPYQERTALHDDPGLYEGQTALHIAIVNRDMDMVRFLVSNGADVRARAWGTTFRPEGRLYYGEYPLSFAASLGQRDIVSYLKRHGARVNVDKDSYGNTALHMTVIHRQCDMYDFLVDYCGALEREPNNEGLTPLVLAAHLDCKEMFQHIYGRRKRLTWRYPPIASYILSLREIDTVQDAAGPTNYVMSTLETAVRKGHSQLMLDPLLNTLLQHKWESFAKAQFITHGLVYLSLVLVQTCLIWLSCSRDGWNSVGRAALEYISFCLALLMSGTELLDYTNWCREAFWRAAKRAPSNRLVPPIYPIPGEAHGVEGRRASFMARVAQGLGIQPQEAGEERQIAAVLSEMSAQQLKHSRLPEEWRTPSGNLIERSESTRTEADDNRLRQRDLASKSVAFLHNPGTSSGPFSGEGSAFPPLTPGPEAFGNAPSMSEALSLLSSGDMAGMGDADDPLLHPPQIIQTAINPPRHTRKLRKNTTMRSGVDGEESDAGTAPLSGDGSGPVASPVAGARAGPMAPGSANITPQASGSGGPVAEGREGEPQETVVVIPGDGAAAAQGEGIALVQQPRSDDNVSDIVSVGIPATVASADGVAAGSPARRVVQRQLSSRTRSASGDLPPNTLRRLGSGRGFDGAADMDASQHNGDPSSGGEGSRDGSGRTAPSEAIRGRLTMIQHKPNSTQTTMVLLNSTRQYLSRINQDPLTMTLVLHMVFTYVHFFEWLAEFGGPGGSGPSSQSAMIADDIILSITSITGWTAIMYFFRLYQGTGTMVSMIEACVVDVLKFLCIYFLFNMGFSLAFYVLHNGTAAILFTAPPPPSAPAWFSTRLDDVEPFSSVGESMMSLWRFMYGQADYIYYCSLQNDATGAFCTLYFVLYTVIVLLLLLNLLGAMIWRTFMLRHDVAESAWRTRWATYVCRAERRMPLVLQQHYRLGEPSRDPALQVPCYAHVFEVDESKPESANRTKTSGEKWWRSHSHSFW